MTPRLHAAVDSYEKAVAPIAARKLTRIAAMHAVSAAFWRDLWPALKDEQVTVARVGWIVVKVKVSKLEPLFRSIFGEPSAPPADAPSPTPEQPPLPADAYGTGGYLDGGDHPLG